MESPISASLGAMGPLLRKLDKLLEPSEGLLRLHKGAKRATHLLKDDLEEITSYLEDLSEVEDPPLTAKCWMKEVRELSYDIEKYIDSFVLPGHVANFKTRSGRRRRIRVRHIKITRLLETNKKLNRQKRVAARISDFRIDAREALERHKRYDLHSCTSIRRGLLPAAGRLRTTYEEGAGIIIDERMRQFMDSMADEKDEQLKVVSVVGSEGIGKTTFVKALYNKLKVQFDCRAFIRLPRKPDIKTVLRDILTQVQQQQPHNHCEDPDLLGKIREHLQYKRYLIVIDDLWSASIWDVISYAFPGGKMCSRIITSTQIEEVALACCYYHSEYVFKMRPLDEDLSRELFFNSLSCPENDFPQKLKDVLSRIVKICGGLPLATTFIASLLATHPVMLMEQWTYIYDSLRSKLKTSSSATEGMKLLVNFSYNNLTCCLKTCLLYLSMYPEGYTVCKDDLVKQWVAEGFINGTEGREVETAESYFHELIGRRFLQPECIKYTGEIAFCSVPDVVRDLIGQKSLEENFVVVLDHYRTNVSLSEKVHRLSLHFPHTKYAMTKIRSSQVRSLSCFGLSKCMPSIREFKLLRVLNLNLSGHDNEDIIDLTWISELLRLRYLKVASDVCIELPKHMGGLQYLETVDISKKVTDVPSDVIHLPRMSHLHLPFETNLMNWLGPAASLWSFGKPTELQYLYLTCFIPVPDHLQRNILIILGSLFRGLGSLKTLAFILSTAHKNAVAHGPSEETVTWDWDDFAPPLLERFEWLLHSCSFSRVPKWIRKLGNLCILKISVRELMRDGVNILGELPTLTTLSLYVKKPPVEMIIFDKAGFSVLKYFKFKCSTVPWLKFEADAMPNLKKLKLGFSAHSHRVEQRSTVPISIEHLPGLKEISAKVADASSDAESALTAAVSNHPRNPRIRMQLVDWNSYGHGVWYTVSKQENPLALEEDKIADPEEGLDAHCVPQYKDSRDDQNKEAYVRLSRHFDLPPASRTSYHHKSGSFVRGVAYYGAHKYEYSKRHMLASILLDESAEPITLDLSLFEDITNNFSTEQEIDQGGFGMVYKGILGDGIVAVKRLCGLHETVHGELTRVVDCLMTVKHSNIVRFLGYWAHMHPNVIEKGRGGKLRIEQQDMLLCFEYLHNGSLGRHISEESCGFEWHKRFQIMKGICQGLDYLHENHIIHLHLKPENILLDANMVPKIADYAYARFLGEDRRTATQETVTSLDYLAPEYCEDGAISVKSDIYSLGVIIMQMVTGHKDHPNIRSVFGGWRSRLESDISQGYTVVETAYRQVILCIELGKRCMHRDPTKRPCIRGIIDMLAEMEASEESSVTSGTSSVPKFRLSGEESEASLITPSSPTSGKASLNHHQEITKSTDKGAVPIHTRVLISNLKLAYNIHRLADSTFDRDLADEFIDRRVPPNARAQEGVSSFDHVIDTSTSLEVRIYRAAASNNGGAAVAGAVTLPILDFLAGAPSPDPFPVILFFHGGSFAHSSSGTAIYDNLCRRFVKLSKGVVVSVNYRRAPEHRYPCAYDDGWAALKWAMSQPFLCSGPDARPRVFLSGDSSGGNIAHHVAVRAADAGISICGNILLNAMFGGTERTDSERRLDGKYFITLQDRDWYWKAYLPKDADQDHPACNPFGPNGRRLRGLPFTKSLIIVSGLDLTCDRQLAYAEGLQEDGHYAKLVYREKATVGFYLLPNTDHYHEVMEEIADFLRANL